MSATRLFLILGVPLVGLACSAPAPQTPGTPAPERCRYLGEVLDDASRAESLAALHARVGQDVLVLGTAAFTCPCGAPANLDGGTEHTRVAGAAEVTRVGGAAEAARVGGSDERARVGGGTESAQVAGAAEGATVAGAAEATRVGGSDERARIGGGTEQRRVGGMDEQTAVGGEVSDVVCTRGGGTLGYALTQNRVPTAMLYDGDMLWRVNGDRLVPAH